MLYVILQEDAPGPTDAIRKAALELHKDYLAERGDSVVLAGPLLVDDGNARAGSFTLVDVPDYATAKAYAEGDPFTRSGLFERTRVMRLRLGPAYLDRLNAKD